MLEEGSVSHSNKAFGTFRLGPSDHFLGVPIPVVYMRVSSEKVAFHAFGLHRLSIGLADRSSIVAIQAFDQPGSHPLHLVFVDLRFRRKFAFEGWKGRAILAAFGWPVEQEVRSLRTYATSLAEFGRYED